MWTDLHHLKHELPKRFGEFGYDSRYLDQIEKEMKAELVAVKEKYGLTHAGLVSAATGDSPIGLSWHEAYKSERATRYTTSRTGVMVEEAVAQYAAHKAAKPDNEQTKEKQPSEKDIRIGLANPR